MTLYFSTESSYQTIHWLTYGILTAFGLAVILGACLKVKSQWIKWVSVGLGLSILGGAYLFYCTSFYAVVGKDRKIVLWYSFPKRSIELSVRDVKMLKIEYASTWRHTPKVYFQIETRNGKTYKSYPMNDYKRLNNNDLMMKNFLKQQLGYKPPVKK